MSQQRVLIADRLSDIVIQQLQSLGAAVTNQPELDAERLCEAVPGFEILVVRSTEVSQAAIDAAAQLGLIVRAGAGVNTIDVAAASRRGIYVTNCPGVNAAAVAELTLGLLVAADRRLVDACVEMRAGRWRKKEYSKSRGLKDRTLGILGFGAIGRAVAARALAMEMHVVAWSRSLTPELAELHGVQQVSSPLEVAAQSNAVSIHLPLNDATRHVINTQFLAAMPPHAILVNTSRGELVDTSALRQAIAGRGLKFASDVFEGEPEGGESTWNDVDLARQITCTPHIGASTDQTSEAIGREVVRIIRDYLQRGTVPGAVNILDRTPATHRLVVRHYNRVGVLATVLDGLRLERINVEEMQNQIFQEARAALCVLALDGPPSSDFLRRLAEDENILQVALDRHE